MESDPATEPLWPDLAEVNVCLRAELAAAIKQRDEARQELCRVIGYQRDRFDPKEIAAERGWDCYKEGGGA